MGKSYGYECVTIRARQAEGIASAKARGTRFGRLPKPQTEKFYRAFRRWEIGEISGSEAARESGMPLSTFLYRAKRCEEGNSAARSLGRAPRERLVTFLSDVILQHPPSLRKRNTKQPRSAGRFLRFWRIKSSACVFLRLQAGYLAAILHILYIYFTFCAFRGICKTDGRAYAPLIMMEIFAAACSALRFVGFSARGEFGLNQNILGVWHNVEKVY